MRGGSPTSTPTSICVQSQLTCPCCATAQPPSCRTKHPAVQSRAVPHHRRQTGPGGLHALIPAARVRGPPRERGPRQGRRHHISSGVAGSTSCEPHAVTASHPLLEESKVRTGTRADLGEHGPRPSRELGRPCSSGVEPLPPRSPCASVSRRLARFFVGRDVGVASEASGQVRNSCSRRQHLCH